MTNLYLQLEFWFSLSNEWNLGVKPITQLLIKPASIFWAIHVFCICRQGTTSLEVLKYEKQQLDLQVSDHLNSINAYQFCRQCLVLKSWGLSNYANENVTFTEPPPPPFPLYTTVM